MGRELQVCEDLSAVNWEEALHGFDFDYYQSFDEEVESDAQVQGQALVLQRNVHLAF